MDWNFRVFKSFLGFAVIIALAVWFAIATQTWLYALAGGAAALAVQFLLYWWGTSRGVGQGFDLTLPMHRMTRWGNTWFRTIKTCAELIFIVGIVAIALLRFNSLLSMASFVGFALLLTSIPLPVVLWAYYAKVLRPSRQAMAPRQTVATPGPAGPVPRASAARALPAKSALTVRSALPLKAPGTSLTRLPPVNSNPRDPDDSTL